jgi:hypothetical protein
VGGGGAGERVAEEGVGDDVGVVCCELNGWSREVEVVGTGRMLAPEAVPSSVGLDSRVTCRQAGANSTGKSVKSVKCKTRVRTTMASSQQDI